MATSYPNCCEATVRKLDVETRIHAYHKMTRSYEPISPVEAEQLTDNHTTEHTNYETLPVVSRPTNNKNAWVGIKRQCLIS